jgi:hypothetical protein
MAEANKKPSTAIWLSEAGARLAEGHGGSSRVAEELLRDEVAADRMLWGYLKKRGDAPDGELWQSARIDLEECYAITGYDINDRVLSGTEPLKWLGIGTGTGRHGLWRTEWFGIWMSPHVLALLPEDSRRQKSNNHGASGMWIAAEIERMRPDEIPATITELARELAHRMDKAAKINRAVRPIKARSIENRLREWGLWPVTPR